MADRSFAAVPQDLKDERAVRLFLETVVVEINKLRDQVEAQQEAITALGG